MARSVHSATRSDSSPRRRDEHLALGGDQVAEVSVGQRGVALLTQHVQGGVQLQLAAAIGEVEEHRLAVAAAGRDPPGKASAGTGLGTRLEVGVSRAHVGHRHALNRARRVGVDARRPQGVELRQAIGPDLGFGVCAHSRRVKRP